MEKIFYSWQSDLPNSVNRGFIQKSLEAAAKSIRNDDSLNIEPVIDRDTRGTTGSPDIAETIFSKIDEAKIFVCDVSIINSADCQSVRSTEPTPNPNVLVELGYAVKSLGWWRVILVMNTAYGGPEMLPFDLRSKLVTTYCVEESNEDKSIERKNLEGCLKGKFAEILTAAENFLPSLSSSANLLLKRMCEAILLQDQPELQASKVRSLSVNFTDELRLDSLKVLEGREHIKVSWLMGKGDFVMVTVKPKSFEIYAKANMSGYNKIVKEVKALIASRSCFNSHKIAESLGKPHALIKLLCLCLKDEGLIRASEISGAINISDFSPELKDIQ